VFFFVFVEKPFVPVVLLLAPPIISQAKGFSMTRKVFAAAVAAAAVVAAASWNIDAQSRGDHWVGTWATAVVARPQPPAAGQPPAAPPQLPLSATGLPNACQPAAFGPGPGRGGRGPAAPQAPLNFKNQTLRQIVHTSLGGDRVRVVLSNAFGTLPLEVGAAHVALREKDAAIQPKSDRPLTFGGNAATMIAAGAVVVSDPVSLTVPTVSDLVVDIYLPGDTAASSSPLTTHQGASQTNYISAAEGNHVGEPDFTGAATTGSWFFLARVEVAAPANAAAVVAFGDSITDGAVSTPNTNNRWPDEFARRLTAQKMSLGVLNQGISGNRVLCDGAGVSALARFDRDVLVQPGAKYVVVLESINDIGIGRNNPVPSASDLIAAHRQLIERAHSHGLLIYGATLTPFEGAAYFTPEGEAKRQAVNAFIRTGKAYDGVIDFDAAVRDPMAPSKIQMKFNPGDNLHMNDAGYQAMAGAIDLSLFKK
jgi:lysophospholipase L1-like esterase